MSWTCHMGSPEATQALGQALARCAGGGEVVALRGGLGAGKTCFAQGVGAGLGVEGPVTSPTFVLVNEYPGRLPLLHADLYRVRPGEVEGIGLEEALETWPGVALVEWAERHPDALPVDHLELSLESDGSADGSGRQALVRATGPRAAGWLAAWRTEAEASGAA